MVNESLQNITNETIECCDVKTLATILGICDKTAYALMKQVDFPSIRIGKRYVVRKEALREWLKRQENAKLGGRRRFMN